MHYVVRIVATAVLLAAGSAGAGAQEAGDARAGLSVAQNTCAACHAIEKEQARSPNPDAPTFATIAAVPGMTMTALLAALQTSHRERTMPNLILPPDETRNVIAYILSLK
jgi:mono/diheme cytochrome c family protein